MVTVINKMSLGLLSSNEVQIWKSTVEKRYEGLMELEPESEADVGFIPEPYSEPTCRFNDMILEDNKNGCPYCRCVIS